MEQNSFDTFQIETKSPDFTVGPYKVDFRVPKYCIFLTSYSSRGYRTPFTIEIMGPLK